MIILCIQDSNLKKKVIILWNHSCVSKLNSNTLDLFMHIKTELKYFGFIHEH